MTVLTIIGILLAALVLYIAIEKLNSYTDKKFNYLFFDVGTFVPVAISYLLLFFGNKWYQEAIEKSGDILNGAIVFGIGVIILLVIIYKNFKATNFIVGLFGTVFQLAIYTIGTGC